MHVRMVGLDLVYCQATGCLYLADDENARTLLCVGYSGRGSGRNDPDAEKIRAFGPIPRGMWTVEPASDHPTLGPCVFALKPQYHNAHGRTEFFIHGDNRKGDGSASTGCIIAPRPAREAIRALAVRYLHVV